MNIIVIKSTKFQVNVINCSANDSLELYEYEKRARLHICLSFIISAQLLINTQGKHEK